ncbi:unnamed protein product, partial [Gulo gulo]
KKKFLREKSRFVLFDHRKKWFRKRKARQGSRQLSMYFVSSPENLSIPLTMQFLEQAQGDNADGCGRAKYFSSNTVLGTGDIVVSA